MIAWLIYWLACGVMALCASAPLWIGGRDER